MDEERLFQLMTTFDTVDGARTVAAALLEGRLAACVQIVGPIESHFWWRGRVEGSEEWLCIVKTTESALGPTMSRIRELHSYDVPELTDLQRRAATHLSESEMKIVPIRGLNRLTEWEAKGLEQYFFDKKGLSNLANERNEIARSNPMYGAARSRARMIYWRTMMFRIF